jgi:hypothetical protein
MRDLSVLDFLWTWKVASSPMLAEVAFRGKSNWWTYKALRQLQQEKYIQLLPRGKNLEQELWALADLGFEVVLMDRDDILFQRYRPHAPTHDYLATCLQLGDIWQSRVPKRFLTEQMLASLSPMNFPKALKKMEGHVPDGITMIQGSNANGFIGYEVDLNLKERERYKSTFGFYETGLAADLVFWLVRHEWMANRILEIFKEDFAQFVSEEFVHKFCFVLVDEFKTQTWSSRIIFGKHKGQSIRNLHANLIQTLDKSPPNFGQKEMWEIFFPRFKSPQKAMICENSKTQEIY